MSRSTTSNFVLLRDLGIFQLKLLLDGIKGTAVALIALAAAVIDLLTKKPGRLFYRVLSLGERLDLWLNLYGAARKAPASGDGLFGASKAGTNTMLGKLEAIVRKFGFEDPTPDNQDGVTRRRYAA
jgi:hypothetical protein